MKRRVRAHCAVFKNSLVAMAEIPSHSIARPTCKVTIHYDDGKRPPRRKPSKP